MATGVDFFRDNARFGARPALHQRGRWTSHAELSALADRFAHGLPRQRGLAFLHCRNDVASIAAYIGLLRAGYAVFLHGEDEGPRLAALVDRYRPQVVCTAGDGGVRTELRDESPPPLHPDLRVLLSTSGSTGTPKLVMLSEANLASNAAAICEYLGIDGTDRAVTSLRFHYSYGMSVVNTHLAAGASLVLTDETVAAPAFWDLLAETGATSFAGVPYTFELLAGSDAWARTPGLRTVTQAGGRLAPDMVRRLARLGRANGWRFFVMYGQTEAAPRMAYLPPGLAEDHPDCIGVPIPGGRLDIVDEHGRPIAASAVPGELAYSGPNVMLGYAQSAADLARDSGLDRLLTGDIAVRTPEGLFRIIGRSARMVKPFGLRVNLDEVEAMVRAQVPDAVCTGDDAGIVIACPGAPAREGEAARIARALGLPPHAVRLVSVPEIPLLPSGKPDYRAMLALGRTAEALVRGGWLDAAWTTLRSPALYRRVLAETGAILGLSHLPQESIRAIFATMTGREPASEEDDFLSLAGDSLSFVQTGLAIEDYLGFLPDGWEAMSIAELEAERRDEAVL